MKITKTQRLIRARLALMNHTKWCLYTGLLLLGKLEIKELSIPSAGTNGRDVYVDPRFIDKLDEAELRFILLHENEHKALRQIDRYNFLWKISPMHANVAADIVVNLRLLDADEGEGFIKKPPIAGEEVLRIDRFRGMHTKQVFDILMQEFPPKDGGGGLGLPEGFDEHDADEAESMTQEEKDALKDEVDAAVRQGGLIAGKRGANNNRLLQDALESQIRWQEILAEFIKAVTKGRDNASWQKVNRRFVYQGLYLPSTTSETVGELLVGIDASGSTWSGNQLEGFVGELIAIAEDVVPEKICVTWWDTSVNSVQEYNPENYNTMQLDLKIAGGGGTSPSCVTKWVKKQNPKRDFVAAIMLSDGQVGSDWGNWSGLRVDGSDLPVLWCLNSRGITSPVGQTLYIEEV